MCSIGLLQRTGIMHGSVSPPTAKDLCSLGLVTPPIKSGYDFHRICLSVGNLHPCLNVGSLNKNEIYDFEKNAPGLFLIFGKKRSVFKALGWGGGGGSFS
jgi:hypothetical protein